MTALDLDAVGRRAERFANHPSGLNAYESAGDVRELLGEVGRLRARLDKAHDALTRITEADDDCLTTLESTVEYVVSSWRAIAAAEGRAADEIERLRKQRDEWESFALEWKRQAEAPQAERNDAMAAVERVESLCRSYTPEPPPIFAGPGLSEFGHGNNHGTKTLAQAVLAELRGEEGDNE